MNFIDILLKLLIFLMFVVFGLVLWSIKFGKKKKSKSMVIWVRPKNYRSIALHAIENCENPVVWADGTRIQDFSEKGLLVQKLIGRFIDFVIKNGDEEVLGFHDHPDQMWVSQKYKHIAQYCAEQGWLKIDKHSRHLFYDSDFINTKETA